MTRAERQWLKPRAGTEGLVPKGTKEAELVGLGDHSIDCGRRHSYLAFLNC